MEHFNRACVMYEFWNFKPQQDRTRCSRRPAVSKALIQALFDHSALYWMDLKTVRDCNQRLFRLGSPMQN